ncbi:MAG: UDP-N-acetylmuramate--L-alanine ligase [Candidatus Omnitrophica bacterium]|nr:UDP-N-acetylmuramate--L-alanine ligase [Candidatus Omnitrophota bacterium]
MAEQIHFIGIGGIGMSGIAKLAALCGSAITGSDVKESKITDELKGIGIKVFLGHAAGNIEGADLVVYSSAIKEDNPEFQEAVKRNIPVIKRAEALARLMRDKSVITVTGSHGKTTTTSLVYCMLLEAQLSPTAAVGGILHNIGTNACAGTGEFFVAEADESDGSFLYYRPKYSIITNIDREHLDYYKDYEKELAAFKEFISLTREDGCIFACADDANLKGLLKNCSARRVLFGLDNKADIYPQDVWLDGLSSEFNCYYKGELLERFSLPLGGMHNISNSLAAIALGIELRIPVPIIKRALAGFKGTGRRIEVKFRNNDYIIIDDYAHHPTEIKATLAAVKNLKPRNRLIAIFQPHRYSRTKLLLEDFARSFDLADYVITTDIYAASEPPIPGIEGRSIYEAIKKHAPAKKLFFLPKQEIVPHIIKNIRSGDIVVTLGAGDIIKSCDELVERLKS